MVPELSVLKILFNRWKSVGSIVRLLIATQRLTTGFLFWNPASENTLCPGDER
jgi:hypothetical protein